MKTIAAAIASFFLVFTVISPASAQRSIGAKSVILDDGLAHTITIQTPIGGWTGNIPFVIPIPPPGSPASGFTYAGTAVGQVLQWVAPNTTGPAPNNYPGGLQGSWQPVPLNALGAVTGTGTSGTIPIWTGPSSQGNSSLTDNGTTLSYAGTHINSSLDYQIGSTTVLSVAGVRNLFAGAFAGINTTGSNNTFVGFQAGQTNAAGNANTFTGYRPAF